MTKKVIRAIASASIFAALLLPYLGTNADPIDCNAFNKEPEKQMLGILAKEARARPRKTYVWGSSALGDLFKKELTCLGQSSKAIADVTNGTGRGRVEFDFFFDGIGSDRKDYAIQVLINPTPKTLARSIDTESDKLLDKWNTGNDFDVSARWIIIIADKVSYHCEALSNDVARKKFVNCPKNWEEGKIVGEVGTAEYKTRLSTISKRTVWATIVGGKQLFAITCVEKFPGACSRSGVTLRNRR